MNTDAYALQQQLIDSLKEEKAIVSQKVEAAFQHVPRHLFLRHLPPEQVYVNKTIPIALPRITDPAHSRSAGMS